VSGHVPLEEYKQIKASWRTAPVGKGGRRFDFGTARENLERCHENLRNLAVQQRELADLHDRLPPGDNRRLAQKDEKGREILPSLQDRIRNNHLEQAHWREYVSHYQPLAAAEPQPRKPTDPLPQDAWVGRPREPGEDDVDFRDAAPLLPDPRLPPEHDPDDIGTGAAR
jgi:hypothetical protein